MLGGSIRWVSGIRRMVDHHIDGSVLLSKRLAKLRFRQGILDSWKCLCAYCGRPAGTLDHVRPRCKGGHTVAQNLIAACADCNRAKGSEIDWVRWFRAQAFWDPEREADIWLWLHSPRAA